MSFQRLREEMKNNIVNKDKKQKMFHYSFNSQWDFAKDLHLTAEILADTGVSVLEDDENSCDSACNKPASKVVLDQKNDVVYLEPTPPGNTTAISSPPKLKHRCDSPFRIPDDSSPFMLRRRSRNEALVGDDAFARLSDEVILQIFKWLPKPTLKHCASVCKRWKTLSYDESLWKCLDLGRRKLNPNTLGYGLQRGVTTLRLADSELVTPLIINLPASFPKSRGQRVSKLQHLDLSRVSVNPKGLEDLLCICTSLINLSLENCELNDTICSYISGNRYLERLNLAMCSHISSNGIQSILQRCQRLQEFNLAWTSLSKCSIDTAINHLPTGIISLNLSGCRYTLTDANVENLAHRCMHLQDLDLSDAAQITQESISSLIKYLDDLKTLGLSRCCNIDPASFEMLISMPTLTNLEIFNVLNVNELQDLKLKLPEIKINKLLFSTAARPTTGIHRTSLWGHRVRD